MPPSSIETLSTCSADCSISVLPTSVEPVKDSFRVLESFSSGSITAPERLEVITFSTPPGRPASSKIFASANIDRGVCWAGLMTIVQPAATAGAILRVPIAVGKFQGVTNTHGPTGWRSVRMRPLPVVLTM